MSLIIEDIEIKTNCRGLSQYKKIGYTDFVRNGGNCFTLTVKSSDVLPASKTKVHVQCDYCGKIVETTMRLYTCAMTKVHTHKYACHDCEGKKIMDSCLDKYGCHFTQTKEYQEQRIKDNMEKYGVPYALQSQEVKDKIKETNFKKFGVSHPSKLKENQEKRKNTVRAKYGYDFVSQVPEFKQKIENTCFERYGSKSPMQNKEIASKVLCTQSKNGTAPCSSQQYHIWEIIGGELNAVAHGFCLDIVKNGNIDIEYNGSGHNLSVLTGQRTQEEFDKRERSRRACLLHNGYKIVELNSVTDNLPDDAFIKEILDKAIFFLENFEDYRIVIDLDTFELTTFM